MPASDTAEPREWLDRARVDLEAAQFLFAHGKAPPVVAVQVQQAAEKALKALLLAAEVPLRRTHDLELLLADAVEVEPALAEFEPFCESATAFYSFERYPALAGPLLSNDDLEVALQEAEALLAAIARRIEG